MKIKNNYLTALTCAALLGSTALSQGATILFDFDDGTTQGWSELTGPTGPAPLDATYGLSSAGPQSGTGNIRMISGDVDTTTNLVVWTSPTIQFDLTSGLTAWMGAGAQGAALNQTLGVVSPTTTVGGFRGIALFDVAANNYLLTTGKSGNNNNNWLQVAWTQAQLTTAGVTTSGTYRLHLIDQATGAWGHTRLDTVSFNGTVIPEPSSALLGGLGLLALLRRRR